MATSKTAAVLNAINIVLRKTLHCETEEDLAKTCLEVAEELTASKFGLIHELNEEGKLNTIAISNPGWDACTMPSAEAAQRTKNVRVQGIYRSVASEGQPMFTNSPAAHPDSVGVPKGHPELSAFLGVPLKKGDTTIGLIGLGNKAAGYTTDDQHAIEALAPAIVESLTRKRAELALRAQEERLAKETAAVTAIVGNLLRGELDDQETEKRVLDACLDATDSAYGMIGVVNEQGQYDTTSYNSQTMQDCAFPEALAWQVSTRMTIRGIWGWPLLHGEPLLCNDLGAHPDRIGLPKGHVPIKCFLGIPLKKEARVVGMVAVANKAGGYTEADAETLSRLGSVMIVSQRHREALVHVRERTTQLEAVNKELESFAYSVSHDLRAPLRAIEGFSAALVEDCHDKLGETGRDYLDRVSNAARRMSKQINDLLELSRVTRTEMRREQVDLSAIALQTTAMLQQQEPDRDVVVVVADDVTVEGDSRLLRQVLENLLGNAWKFTQHRNEPRIEFGATEESKGLTCFVRDNGAGFDMAYEDMLFVPFKRLHSTEAFPGTGVGLSTVFRIIKRHGGRIWYESAVDRGASFYFTLFDDA